VLKLYILKYLNLRLERLWIILFWTLFIEFVLLIRTCKVQNNRFKNQSWWRFTPKIRGLLWKVGSRSILSKLSKQLDGPPKVTGLLERRMTLKTGLQLNSLAPGGPLNVMQTLKLSIVAKSLKLNQHHPSLVI
jgi:hypothetical protein